MLKKLFFFLEILRFNRAVYTSVEFILAYLFSLYIFWINFDIKLFWFYYFMYLVAFGLVYPIVYIYNDITDVEKDKLNKKRLKYKPLAAWKISLNDFLWLWILWIGIWLVILSFAPNLFIFFLGIGIVFNFFYTRVLKHLFMIENFANAFTHSFVRVPLWILLAINWLIIQKHILFLIVFILLHFIVLSLWATYKRYLEFKMWNKTRKTLKKYSLDFFLKAFVVFNVLYLLLWIFLLYLKFDIFLVFLFVFVFFMSNLAVLWWKNPYLDEIIIRLYAW